MDFNNKSMKIEHNIQTDQLSSSVKYIKEDMDAVVLAQCILQADNGDGTKHRFIHGDYDAVVTVIKCLEEVVPPVTKITKASTVEQKCHWLLTMHRYRTIESMYELLMLIQ